MLCSRLLSFVTQVKQSKVKKIWHSIAKEESRRRMSSESAVLAAEPAPASNGPPSDKEDKKRVLKSRGDLVKLVKFVVRSFGKQQSALERNRELSHFDERGICFNCFFLSFF